MRLIDDILRAFTISFVVAYLDDILILNKCWAKHLKHIQRYLNTLWQHKLHDNLEKCSFGMNRVQYLNYIVDEHGMHMDLAKIQVIYDYPSPTILTELCSFLILDNFYHRLMLGFSHIAWPLSQVTMGGCKSKFAWAKSQHKTFDDIKHFLCSTLVLTLPNLQQPYEIEINTSDYIVGIVFTQHGHPLAYHSGKILDAIHKYPSYEKEMYSIVQAYWQWKHYILRKEMIIHTDHGPLQFMQT